MISDGRYHSYSPFAHITPACFWFCEHSLFSLSTYLPVSLAMRSQLLEGRNSVLPLCIAVLYLQQIGMGFNRTT